MKLKDVPHLFTEALAVLPAGEVQVPVQMEVVRRELGHPHDGPLALVLDGVRPLLLLGLPHQSLLQTGDDLALRVDVLRGGANGEGGGRSERETMALTVSDMKRPLMEAHAQTHVSRGSLFLIRGHRIAGKEAGVRRRNNLLRVLLVPAGQIPE